MKTQTNQTEERIYTITGLDAVILLIHVLQGAKHPEVGFEDVDNTRGQLKQALDCEVQVPQSVLESALWSANLMDEAKAFWHPDGLSFSQFVNRMIDPEDMKFDRFYNILKSGESYNE